MIQFIINDLDFLCINEEIIKKIAKFAKDYKIPLIVDPKRNRIKYNNIKATMILPNLYEWCHLINEPDREKHWRDQLDNKEVLVEMAQRSLYYLGNFTYHIIKCDKDGIIAITPSAVDKNIYNIYRMPPCVTQNSHQQLGCGDVITGIMAISIDKNSESKQVLDALNYANCVVAAYREQPWLKMPTLKDINEKLKNANSKKWQEPKGSLTKGITYLPKENEIKLSDFKTIVPELYSNNRNFKNVIIDLLIEDIEKGNSGKIHSIILDGPAGCGKSSLMQYIISKNKEESITFSVDFSDELLNCDLNNLEIYFSDLRKKYNIGENRILLLIVDEALKKKKNIKNGKSFIEEHGVNILNAAHKQNIRFLLIDATFNEKYYLISNEVKSRCKKYALPALKNRPGDVPIIVAGILRDLSKSRSIEIKIDKSVILAFINKLLKEKEFSPREIVSNLTTIFNKDYTQDIKVLEVKFDSLPNEYKNLEQKFFLNDMYNIK
ncbi:hypothetical protein JT05_05100 [Desulfosporosinus sp. Tol-M]|nr:hypothetical protein JT05_05100 [Desulfosporosinus sp. Tol-M]